MIYIKVGFTEENEVEGMADFYDDVILEVGASLRKLCTKWNCKIDFGKKELTFTPEASNETDQDENRPN